MKGWASEEIGSVDFGDIRLNNRAVDILEKFFASPNSSIKGSFNAWGEIKASYRFFDDMTVDDEKILTPHKVGTLQRVKSHDVVLCVQDTAIINYSHRKRAVEGLGKLRREGDRGFLLHPTIAFNDSGLCLGLLCHKTWIRDEIKGKKLRQIVKPIEEKESMRWVESYRLTDTIAKRSQDKLFINIADRE